MVGEDKRPLVRFAEFTGQLPFAKHFTFSFQSIASLLFWLGFAIAMTISKAMGARSFLTTSIVGFPLPLSMSVMV